MSEEQLLEKLIRIGFLSKNEGFEVIRGDLHYTKLWADAFWRRRFSHEKRVDPEIRIIKELNFQNVLEIGSGYGRIAYKVLEEYPETNYTGIDVSPSFSKYHVEYSEKKKHRMQLLHLNFFKEDLEGKYDLILLPMNTLPTLPFQALVPLFDKVRTLLSDKGSFVFTTYKLPNQIEDMNLTKFTRNRSGELLIDEDRITIETYQLDLQMKEYGVKSTNVQLYHRLNNSYDKVERGIFWTQNEYVVTNIFDELILKSGLQFEVDETDHSRVYTVHS